MSADGRIPKLWGAPPVAVRYCLFVVGRGVALANFAKIAKITKRNFTAALLKRCF
jgi:hypothetical protein